MVDSVLPKNLLYRISFVDLLQMEDAYNSHPLSEKRYNWNRKTSQEHLYKQLYKLFPEEGNASNILAYFILLKKFLKNINILKS